MKKFIRKVAWFLLPIVILAYPIDYFLSSNLKKSISYAEGEYLVWNDIYESRIDADIAIYGSSRAWHHFDPRIIGDSLHATAYNFGIDAHNFWLEYLRHKEYLRYNKKPKLILMSVDVFSFEKKPELINADQFLPYLFRKDVREFTSSYEGYSWFDYRLPLLRYYGKMEVMLRAVKNFAGRNGGAPARVKGYMGVKKKWNSDMDMAKQRKKHYRVNLDTASIQLFDTFLAECQAGGIPVVIIYSPEYIEGQHFTQNREEGMKLYRDFSKKYNVPFLDYSADAMCTDREYFYNATHLNRYGAEVFTRKLVTDLKSTLPAALLPGQPR